MPQHPSIWSRGPWCALCLCSSRRLSRVALHVAPHRVRRLVHECVARGTLHPVQCGLAANRPSFHRPHGLPTMRWPGRLGAQCGTCRRGNLVGRAVCPARGTSELPTDRPRGSVKSFRGATARCTIATADYQRIKRFGATRMYSVRHFAGGIRYPARAAVASIRHCRRHPRGRPVADRGRMLVGHCVNFLPLRTVLAPEATVAETLRRVRADLIDAYEHQNYTFGSLVPAIGLAARPEPAASGRSPIQPRARRPRLVVTGLRPM